MARAKQPCKNHPDRLTARRCYHCHAPVCSECISKLERHYFCGRWCFVKWKAGQFFLRVKKIPNLQIYLLASLILLTNLFLFFYFNHKLDSLKKITRQQPPTSKSVTQRDSAWFYVDSTFRPIDGKFGLSLRVSDGLSVSVWRDGKLMRFASGQGGKIQIQDIPLLFGDNKFVIWAHQADGATHLVDSLNIFYRSARLEFLARPFIQGAIDSRMVALTFDAGSSDRGAQEILKILRDKGLRCTMFITGRFLEKFPQVVMQMVKDGHEVGNHTYSHPHLTTYEQNRLHHNGAHVGREFVISQLLKVDSLFMALTGRRLAPYWRAPFGEYNRQILRWAAEAGFKQIAWSPKCDALDWVEDSTQTLYRSSAQILEHFLQLEKNSGLNGKIILMHLGTDRKNDFPYLALPALIDSLRSRGYRFATISELINQRASQ
ncbi:polysaccharide deacetylase family protein [Caldithrix abyssi]